MPFRCGSTWLLAALLAHLALGLLRVPSRVVDRRRADIAACRESGPAAFLLGQARFAGADAIAWLQANTAPDAAILYRGEGQGALEFAPALLWPRLLVAAHAASGDHHAGRPIARGQPPGATHSGPLLLVGEPTALRLTVQ